MFVVSVYFPGEMYRWAQILRFPDGNEVPTHAEMHYLENHDAEKSTRNVHTWYVKTDREAQAVATMLCQRHADAEVYIGEVTRVFQAEPIKVVQKQVSKKGVLPA